eukprot:scaffold2499_cov129-Isochrysis_galbana.AAC.6
MLIGARRGWDVQKFGAEEPPCVQHPLALIIIVYTLYSGLLDWFLADARASADCSAAGFRQ